MPEKTQSGQVEIVLGQPKMSKHDEFIPPKKNEITTTATTRTKHKTE